MESGLVSRGGVHIQLVGKDNGVPRWKWEKGKRDPGRRGRAFRGRGEDCGSVSKSFAVISAFIINIYPLDKL